MGVLSRFDDAVAELKMTAKMRYLWVLMAWFDVKQRYRRSLLGPFWITLNTAVLVGVLSLLWSTIFKMKLADYMPYFAIGHIVWSFVSTQINEACNGFSQFEQVIRQIRLPFPSYILRILARNLIVFAHNIVIVLLVLIFFQINPGWYGFIAILGLLIVSLLLVGVSIIVAIFCTRFRDLSQLVQNFLMIGFYVTPIVWKSERLSADQHWLVDFNPLAHMMSLIREPLLGHGDQLTLLNFAVALGAAVFVMFVALFMLGKYRDRIAYWV